MLKTNLKNWKHNMDFKPFSRAVAQQFTAMSAHELYTVDLSGDDLYALYLASFPEGSNPIFRERTEHDCSCCRNFIRNIGNVVVITEGGHIGTVWSLARTLADVHPAYREVAEALDKAVKAAKIIGIYRTSEPTYGAEASRELHDGVAKTWNHFYGRIATKHFTKVPDQVKGEFNSNLQVFKRGVTELKVSAINVVVNLIEQNALYRGEEHMPAIRKFNTHMLNYGVLKTEAERQVYLMQNANDPATRFRNTAIGSLIVDLSEGMDLEAAVKSFETKVAPTNYKRTTSLVTEGMIKDAVNKINELGLESALNRRMANIHDITMNNVLWADNSVKPMMKGTVEALLAGVAKPKTVQPDSKSIIDISVPDFLHIVMPTAESMDLVVRNTQQSNFVTLTAPVEENLTPLFKWNNNFAWSYDGNITDAIKERVKTQGGKVTGDLMCRLAWDYTDDLDFHMVEPGGSAVSFYSRNTANGGHLDVDANGGNGMMAEPVENITYADRKRMRAGIYVLKVNNYARRDPTAKGFTVQVEFDGTTYQFEYDKALHNNETVSVAEIKVSSKGEFTLTPLLPVNSAARSNIKWGITTETPVPVKTVMYSPNHWDDNAIGNKHVIFILEDCRTDEPTRGIYNEFLRSDLEKHRKVFEILGNKTKCQPTEDQLSGVGFSSTKSESVLVTVTSGKTRKTYNVKF